MHTMNDLELEEAADQRHEAEHLLDQVEDVKIVIALMEMSGGDPEPIAKLAEFLKDLEQEVTDLGYEL